MEKIKEYVKHTNLAPIIASNITLEPIPLEFRGQESVNFIVTFDEYLMYIKNQYLYDKYLMSSLLGFSDTLKKYRRGIINKESMTKAFLCDMSGAVASEIWYSEKFSVVATSVTCEFVTAHEHEHSNASEKGDIVKQNEKILLNLLEHRGYIFNNDISDKNLALWNYALALMTAALKL